MPGVTAERTGLVSTSVIVRRVKSHGAVATARRPAPRTKRTLCPLSLFLSPSNVRPELPCFHRPVFLYVFLYHTQISTPQSFATPPLGYTLRKNAASASAVPFGCSCTTRWPLSSTRVLVACGTWARSLTISGSERTDRSGVAKMKWTGREEGREARRAKAMREQPHRGSAKTSWEDGLRGVSPGLF